jgi:hypothetical protein
MATMAAMRHAAMLTAVAACMCLLGVSSLHSISQCSDCSSAETSLIMVVQVADPVCLNNARAMMLLAWILPWSKHGVHTSFMPLKSLPQNVDVLHATTRQRHSVN